jgi:hypothetical protein
MEGFDGHVSLLEMLGIEKIVYWMWMHNVIGTIARCKSARRTSDSGIYAAIAALN